MSDNERNLQILHQAGISDERIFDPANPYSLEEQVALVQKIQEEQTSKVTLKSKTLDELLSMKIEPLVEIVPGFLPQGLTIVAASPKLGKSWLMLDLCLSVTEGRKFLGFRTNQCGAMYLALEDSDRRLIDRIKKLRRGCGASQERRSFITATEAHTTDTGLLEQLENELGKHPDIKLIVIDTFQLVRGRTSGKDVYASDYREAKMLKRFADTHKVALILVHHIRKTKDETDPFNNISGSTGMTGAADTMIVLTKAKRTGTETTLSLTSRDVETQELELVFDKETCLWQNRGSADELSEKRETENYEQNPLVKTLRKLLEPSGEWSGRAGELMAAGKMITGKYIAPANNKVRDAVRKIERDLLKRDNIVFVPGSNGTGGSLYRFVDNSRLGHTPFEG